MYAHLIVATVTLLSLVKGINIDTPNNTTVWDTRERVVVTWVGIGTVNPDMNVTVVVNNENPEVLNEYVPLGTVNVTNGQLSADASKLAPGTDYYVALLAGSLVLTKSDDFAIKNGSSADPSTSASAGASGSQSSSPAASTSGGAESLIFGDLSSRSLVLQGGVVGLSMLAGVFAVAA